MWVKCALVLDEPVKIWGLEWEDWAVVASMPLVLAFLFDAMASFGLTACFGIVLYILKRGKPPGALLHTLHGLELARIPGVLGPKPQRYSAW